MKQRMRRWWFVMLGVCVLTLATILPRVAAFGNFPPSPYWEELALGYDAFSLLQTGADHHGHPWPVVAFESFGDWKPSGYFYAAVLPIAVFGLDVLSVRLPSIVAGILLVPGMGLLTQRLLTRVTMKTSLQEPVVLDPFVQKITPWVVMGVAALNPWLVQFSRSAWEVNLATTLLEWAMVLLWSKTLRSWHFVLSVALALYSAYTYHAMRVIVPMVFGSTMLVLFLESMRVYARKALTWKILGASTVFCLGVLPIVFSLRSAQGTQRFTETSIFSLPQPIVEVNEQRAQANDAWWSHLMFHRGWRFAELAVGQWLDHWRLDFLFLSGDTNRRHGTGYTGLFFASDGVALLVGIVCLLAWGVRTRQPWVWLTLLWWFGGMLPSAFSQAAPHALRILPTAPIWMITIGLGWSTVFALVRRWSGRVVWVAMSAAVVVTCVLFIGYWRFATTIYPMKDGRAWWQAGYAEMASALHNTKFTHKTVQITRTVGRPLMAYWFFSHTDPRAVQAQMNHVPLDQGEALFFQDTGLQIQAIRSIAEVRSGNAVVMRADEWAQLLVSHTEARLLKTINVLADQPAWVIAELP